MKYVATILLTALLVGLGVTAYFKGWFPTISFNKPQAVSVQNTEISNVPMQTPQPVTSASQKITVQTGGLLVFNRYTVDVPSDWQYSKDGSVAGQIDKLTLSKGSYSIVFTQAATGGAQCLYPGDADSEMSTRFTTFVDLTTQTGEKLRRSGTGTGGFTVCEKPAGGTSWGLPTVFGHISVQAAVSPTQQMLDEIDAILSSLKKA